MNSLEERRRRQIQRRHFGRRLYIRIRLGREATRPAVQILESFLYFRRLGIALEIRIRVSEDLGVVALVGVPKGGLILGAEWQERVYGGRLVAPVALIWRSKPASWMGSFPYSKPAVDLTWETALACLHLSGGVVSSCSPVVKPKDRVKCSRCYGSHMPTPANGAVVHSMHRF